MPMPSHPLRLRALELMRRGEATPGEISAATGIRIDLVRMWRWRAKLDTSVLRVVRVRRLMNRRW
jgi:hypothetical protein